MLFSPSVEDRTTLSTIPTLPALAPLTQPLRHRQRHPYRPTLHSQIEENEREIHDPGIKGTTENLQPLQEQAL